ncbi:hypothetical protein HOI26_01390 [Candidatus Woesearchaeota archaeon]|jgi:replication factor A1|nr:hypothetical protein [Candidatus Woesearchaeota archaeon]
MYKIPLADLKEKILASGKIGAADLEVKIKEKINELSGLVSEEGAAHILANEFGISLAPPAAQKLKIKEIYAGMRNISTVGKVVRKYDMVEFNKGGRSGKVCSLVLGDDSGTVRVVFWNDQVDQLQQVKEDDVLLVKEAYVRDNRGNKEVHLGQKGEIEINPEGEVVENVRTATPTTFTRKKISELQGGEEGVEVMGTIVQVFDPRFFDVHPETGRRLRDPEPGVVPALSYVMNLVLDDGSGTIRTVFWKQQTNHLLSKTEEDLAGYKDDLASFEDIKTDLLGEQVKVMGQVKKNDMFDRLEISVRMVEKASPEEELAKL